MNQFQKISQKTTLKYFSRKYSQKIHQKNWKISKQFLKKFLRFWKYPIPYIELRGRKPFRACWMIKLKSKHTSFKKFNIQHSSSVLFHSCIQADRKLCSSLPQQLVFLFWFPMLLSQFTAWGNLSQPQAKALAAFPKNKAISKIAKLCNYGFCVLDCQTFLDKEIKKIENSKAHCTRAFSKSRII